MVQYGIEQRFYLNNISIQLKTVSSDRKDKCVYSNEHSRRATVGDGVAAHIFRAILAGTVTFTVTVVNNTFLRGIIQIMFH